MLFALKFIGGEVWNTIVADFEAGECHIYTESSKFGQAV
jgi:hypothetical protein